VQSSGSRLDEDSPLLAVAVSARLTSPPVGGFRVRSGPQGPVTHLQVYDVSGYPPDLGSGGHSNARADRASRDFYSHETKRTSGW
jgi:hypothetical protein